MVADCCFSISRSEADLGDGEVVAFGAKAPAGDLASSPVEGGEGGGGEESSAVRSEAGGLIDGAGEPIKRSDDRATFFFFPQ